MTGNYVDEAQFDLRDPDAEHVILGLHGLGGDRAQPQSMLPGGLPGRAVLAPDLRAHGGTRLIGEANAFTLDQLADDVLGLINKLGLSARTFTILGVSMGAALALRLSAQLHTKSMVLIRPAFSAHACPPNLAAFVRAGELLEKHEPEEALRLFQDTVEYQEVLSESLRAAASLRAQFSDIDARPRSIRLREIPKNVAYADSSLLGSIPIPSLVIGTDRDPNHPLALAEQWAGSLRDGSLITVVPRDVNPDGQLREIQTAVGSFLRRRD